jgi:hypothetical protein
MRNKVVLLIIILNCFACLAHAQQVNSQQKERFVIVPDDVALVTIAFQPDCALQFEEAKLLAAVDGEGGTSGYAVRNKGTKPIRSFTLGLPGGTVTWSEEFTKKLFMPGERTPYNNDIEIVPLTDELRNKLKLNGPLRGTPVFMIIRVDYADGTVYNAESKYKAFLKFSNELVQLRATKNQ